MVTIQPAPTEEPFHQHFISEKGKLIIESEDGKTEGGYYTKTGKAEKHPRGIQKDVSPRGRILSVSGVWRKQK